MDLSQFATTDPELVAWFEPFDADAVATAEALEPRMRHLVRLAATMAAQGHGALWALVSEALDDGVSAVEIKETVYQAIPYLGMAKVYDLLEAVNEALAAHGKPLPTPAQGTTSPEDRFDKGLATQKQMFGDGIDAMRAAAPADLAHVQDYLSANCFGDHYTRGGLTLEERELLTFALLVAQGGCEPQAGAHAKGNVAVGNGRDVLVATVTAMLPLIGYPRTLNGIKAIDEAAPAT